MNIASIPYRIAHISDVHCGEVSFDPELMNSVLKRIDAMNPDLVVVAGDLTAAGYEWEFQEAAEWLDRIRQPKIVVPGNYDSRNVGYIHFERYFGKRFSRYQVAFEAE